MKEIEKLPPGERSDALDADARRRLHELEEKLGPVRARLDGLVRACAGRLFAGPFPVFPTELLYPAMEVADADSASRAGPESPTTAYWNVDVFKHLLRAGQGEDIDLVSHLRDRVRIRAG